MISAEDRMTFVNPDNSIRVKKYVVFFDLDGTIISTYSATALVRMAIRRGLMGRSAVVKAIYLSFLYRLRLRDELRTIHEMMTWLKGASERSVIELSSVVSSEVLIPAIRPEAVASLDFHRQQNAKLVLLSSALEPICRLIAQYLKMDDIICSEPEVLNGIYTGRPLGTMCFEEEKAARLTSYCKAQNIRICDAWYYGDSIADRHVMAVAGHPVCVNPGRKLRKAAEEKKWQIVEWR